jgi:hypothetical protein
MEKETNDGEPARNTIPRGLAHLPHNETSVCVLNVRIDGLVGNEWGGSRT